MAESRVVVVMGVSGSGKSTIARALADRLGRDDGRWELLEGDDLHPPANVAAMAAGIPLDDEDRAPWLAAIGRWVDDRIRQGADAVVTCSALRRSYRDRLREGRPAVVFCHLGVAPAELERRLEHRSGHFMPASMLASQLETLEPLGADEPGITVRSDAPVGVVVAEVVRRLQLAGPPSGGSAHDEGLD